MARLEEGNSLGGGWLTCAYRVEYHRPLEEFEKISGPAREETSSDSHTFEDIHEYCSGNSSLWVEGRGLPNKKRVRNSGHSRAGITGHVLGGKYGEDDVEEKKRRGVR